MRWIEQFKQAAAEDGLTWRSAWRCVEVGLMCGGAFAILSTLFRLACYG